MQEDCIYNATGELVCRKKAPTLEKFSSSTSSIIVNTDFNTANLPVFSGGGTLQQDQILRPGERIVNGVFAFEVVTIPGGGGIMLVVSAPIAVVG